MTIDVPQITQSPVRTTAVIHLTVPREKIREVMGPGHKELMDAVTAQSAGPESGPDPSTWQTELYRPLLASGKD